MRRKYGSGKPYLDDNFNHSRIVKHYAITVVTMEIGYTNQ